MATLEMFLKGNITVVRWNQIMQEFITAINYGLNVNSQ